MSTAGSVKPFRLYKTELVFESDGKGGTTSVPKMDNGLQVTKDKYISCHPTIWQLAECLAKKNADPSEKYFCLNQNTGAKTQLTPDGIAAWAKQRPETAVAKKVTKSSAKKKESTVKAKKEVKAKTKEKKTTVKAKTAVKAPKQTKIAKTLAEAVKKDIVIDASDDFKKNKVEEAKTLSLPKPEAKGNDNKSPNPTTKDLLKAKNAAMAASGHAFRKNNYTEVVKLLSPYEGDLSKKQQSFLDDSRKFLKEAAERKAAKAA